MDNIVVLITQYINGIIFVGVAYYAFINVFKPAVKKRWIILAYAAYLIVTTQVFLAFESPWVNLGINLGTFFMLTFLFLGNRSAKLVFALLIYIISMLADGLSLLSISFFYYLQYGIGVTIEDMLPLGRTVSTIFFLPLALAIILIFRKWINGKARYRQFKIPTQYTIVILIMLIGIVLVNTLLVIVAMPRMQEMVMQVSISHLISSTVIMLVIWLYNTILNHLEEFEKNNQKDQMLKHWEMQYQSAAASQKVVAELEHNIKYHFIKLSGMLKEGNAKSAEEHIAKVLGDFEPIINTGNMAIDTMLNYYCKRIKETLGVELKIELSISADMKFDAHIIVMILGNALENALDACINVAASERFVTIELIHTPQNELLITIFNPYTIAPIADKTGNLMTTKADKVLHGIGLPGIKEMLSKGGGYINHEYDGNIFIFTALLHGLDK